VDPRGFPTTLPEFQRVFPTDEACAKYLENLRWPETFACPKCGTIAEPYRFANRPGVVRCRSCKSDVSLTAGTVMQSTHTSLSTWFWAAYLVTTQTPGQSAMQFQPTLDVLTELLKFEQARDVEGAHQCCGGKIHTAGCTLVRIFRQIHLPTPQDREDLLDSSPM
jgi:hypothetical protein